MMTRVITSVVGLPLMLFFMYGLPTWGTLILSVFLSVLGALEILNVTKAAEGRKGTAVICLLLAAAVPAGVYFDAGGYMHFAVFIFIIACFAQFFLHYDERAFEKIGTFLFAALVVPLFYSGILRIGMREDGIYYIILPFVIAWCCDTFAYLVGRRFGKRKLAPAVSPRKTVEGAIGGLMGSVLGILITGVVMQVGIGFTVNYAQLIVMGIAGSVCAQIGDLSMSVIKRNYDAKDFGHLLPGHGGILDRFDSILFVVPAVELMMSAFPHIFQ